RSGTARSEARECFPVTNGVDFGDRRARVIVDSAEVLFPPWHLISSAGIVHNWIEYLFKCSGKSP
ncbi:MAG: hypothetical protein NZ741_11555, partial [Armatimonadetes bacterium]|nr:hypothetical protein [Armatimonadota bacterium]